jgi:hypothetical protein
MTAAFHTGRDTYGVLMTAPAMRESCQAHPLCDRAPFFQAALEAKDGSEPVSRNVKLCAVHLGDVVQLLATWAQERGLTHGQVTVLIIDPSPMGPPLELPWLCDSPVGGCAFGTISLRA